MGVLLGFIILFLGLGLVFYLVLGLWAYIRKTGKSKKSFKYAGICFAALIVLSFVIPSEDSSSNDEKKDKQVVETHKKNVPKQETKEQTSIAKTSTENNSQEENVEKKSPSFDIGFTTEQFQNEYNKYSQQLTNGSKYNISLNVENGEVQNTFQNQFSDTCGMVGAVNKDTDKVRSITLLGSNFKDTNDSMDYLIVIGILIQTTNPNLSKDERGDIIMKKLDIENVMKNEGSTETVKNNVKYSLSFSSSIGITFSITNPKDK